MMFVALVAKTFLSGAASALATDNSWTRFWKERCSIGILNGPVTTSSGLPLLVDGPAMQPPHYCTLGGLLVVNGILRGLTARHPFGPTRSYPSAQEISSDDFDDASTVDAVDEYGSCDEPYVFEADVDPARENTLVRPLSSDGEHVNISFPLIDTAKGPVYVSDNFPRPMHWFEPRRVEFPFDQTAQIDHDWALLDHLPQPIAMLPNLTTDSNDTRETWVKGPYSGIAQGEVSIRIACSEAQFGYLHASPVTLKMEKSFSVVQLITFESILRKSRRHALKRRALG